MTIVVLLLGLAAGTITTVAGVGGGLLLLLGLMLLFDPATALATTAPALLVGSLHRLVLFRRWLDVGWAWRLGLGALVGAGVGGAVAVELPEGVLRLLLALAAALAALRLVLDRRGRARGASTAPARPGLARAVLLPLGFSSGFLTGTSGGGGVLVPPSLLALGLRGPTYLATTAAAFFAMHLGRLAAYGAMGWMDEGRWTSAGLLVVAIPLGNLLGRAVRARLGEDTTHRFTQSAVLAASGLAVAGLV